MHNQCHAWEDALDNFKYQHIQYKGAVDSESAKETLSALLNEYPDLSDKNIYVCGAEKMVKKTEEVLLDHNANKGLLKIQALKTE